MEPLAKVGGGFFFDCDGGRRRGEIRTKPLLNEYKSPKPISQQNQLTSSPYRAKYEHPRKRNPWARTPTPKTK